MPTPLLSFAGAALTVFTSYCLGAVALRKRPEPLEITLAAGAVIESLIVFLLLLANAGGRAAFLVVAAVAAVAYCRYGRRPQSKPIRVPLLAAAVFVAYGVWYLVNALAPEVTPDGITYHLGLPREYARLGGFPGRATFYDLLPQAMEMLYTVAYCFGGQGAAKLVAFTFFTAALPLILRVSGRLGLTGLQSAVPAALFFCAPVIGLTGSSSYTDAAGVFFLLAAVYLLLTGRMFTAGLFAGFCYAIKMPGLMVAIGAIVWGWRTERLRAAATAAFGAALVIAPWIIRSAVLTGNPLAPLGNGIFPNPYFHVSTESGLATGLRSLGAVHPGQIPWELAFGDRLGGTYGPLLLAVPLGLLALRRREGRMLWAGAAILAVPWIANTGARFLMQSLVVAGFALAMVLPRRASWAAIAVQAILCWPHVLDRIQPPYTFRLHEFPLAAALGIESEDAYCRRNLEEYTVARMIQRAVPPASRTLALLSVANAYLDRDVAVSWQSAEADLAADSLRMAALSDRDPVFERKVTWPARELRALRFRIPPNSGGGEGDIGEVRIFSDDSPLFNSPQWTFAGTHNPWELPLAFDGNPATRWRTWQTVRTQMSFDVDFGHTQRVTGAEVATRNRIFGAALQVSGRDAAGVWRALAANAETTPRAPRDLRLDASRALRGAGFRYLLVPTGADGNSPIGNRIVGHEADWGMERAAEAGPFYLLRVR